MRVKTTELRRIADRLFTYLEETGRGEVHVVEDYYWEFSSEQLYDPSSEPKDLTIGQLSHDWERLTTILDKEDPPIGYALVWLASILRNIGEKSVY